MFNQKWYGSQAELVEQGSNHSIVDYGCSGSGIVTNYTIFNGVQISFLEFNSSDIFPTQSFSSEIVTISHCRAGRYECEFPNHTVACLPQGYFSVVGTKYLPISFSFPLKKYSGLSLVINKQELSEDMYYLLDMMSIDLDKIISGLAQNNGGYVSGTPPMLMNLFSELYTVNGKEPIEYYRIKAIELLYHIARIPAENSCDFRYFDKKHIQSTKKIHDYLICHLNEKPPIAALAKEAKISVSLFHSVFVQIYGDPPYTYMKKYKMNLATQYLMEDNMKISEIAAELGYSNASKFSQAFRSVYGMVPRDYKKIKNK